MSTQGFSLCDDGDTIAETVDLECNTATGFYDQITVTTVNGVAGDPVVTQTDIACSEDDPPVDVEQVRICSPVTNTIHLVTTAFDEDGNVVAALSDVDTGEACEAKAKPDCVESQTWTFGLDNSGTDTRWDAVYLVELSDGSTITFDQTSLGAAAQWTPQLNQWAANLQAAADAAGLQWFVEPRFINNTNPTDISGNTNSGTPSGLPGAPSEPVAVALADGGMRWRYLNVEICPGSPTPTSAEILSIDALNGAPDIRQPGYQLTTAGAVLGPLTKFWLCTECGETPVWYLADGVTPAEPGQIPNCWEPCGTLALTDAPPDRECEFFFAEGCDNNNSDLTDDFTNLVTRRATVCNGEQIKVNYFVPDPDDSSALVDHSLVGEFVDCATGEPIDLPVPPCDEFVSLGNMYQMGNVSGVLRNREWEIGPGQPGFMSVPAGEAIRTSFDESQATTVAGAWSSLQVNDTNNSADVQDVQIIDGYVVVDEAIDVRWFSSSFGYFALEVGECCGPLALKVEGASTEDTVDPTDSYSFAPGIHAIKMWNIDERAGTARNVEYSLDGGTTWITDNTPPGIAFSDVKPAEACIPIVKCIPSGAIVNPLTDEAVDPATLTACPKMCEADIGDAQLEKLCDILAALTEPCPDPNGPTGEECADCGDGPGKLGVTLTADGDTVTWGLADATTSTYIGTGTGTPGLAGVTGTLTIVDAAGASHVIASPGGSVSGVGAGQTQTVTWSGTYEPDDTGCYCNVEQVVSGDIIVGGDNATYTTPAGGTLVTDNAQDGGGNAPFNLQIRNTTNTPTPYEMVWNDRPYSTIPNLTMPAGVTHSVVPTGGGLFRHSFVSTTPLGGFANHTITGGVPNPAGDNDSSKVERFVP